MALFMFKSMVNGKKKNEHLQFSDFLNRRILIFVIAERKIQGTNAALVSKPTVRMKMKMGNKREKLGGGFKTKEDRTEQTQADHELFLQAFESKDARRLSYMAFGTTRLLLFDVIIESSQNIFTKPRPLLQSRPRSTATSAPATSSPPSSSTGTSHL